MKRRHILSWLNWTLLGGGLSGLLSTWLAGCTGGPKKNGGFAEFVRLDVLDESGYILQDYFAKEPIVAVRDPKDKNVIHAVNALCTHQGCLVNWHKDKQVFLCPCHGSSFAADGKYLQGPTNKDLQTFPAKIEGSSVWVKA
jgi:cytochrome b6-f complex iron-sulfur subunit